MTQQEAREIIDKMDVFEKAFMWNHYQVAQAKIRTQPYFYWKKDKLGLEITYQGNSFGSQTLSFDEFIQVKIYDWYWRFEI